MKKHNGQAMIVVVFASLFIIIISAIIITSINNEVRIKMNHKDRIKVRYVAQAGIDDSIFYLDRLINEMLNNEEDILIDYEGIEINYDSGEYGETNTSFFDIEGNPITVIEYNIDNDILGFIIRTEGILQKYDKNVSYNIESTIEYYLDFSNDEITGYNILDYDKQ